jgi:uncharacterized protein YjaG (DUF416 family)
MRNNLGSKMMSQGNATLKGRVERLAKVQQLALLIIMCERAFPALARFASETGFDSTVHRRSLDDVWGALENQMHISGADFSGKTCLANAPDTEDYDHPLTSAALNAVLMIAATVDFLSDGNADLVFEVAELAHDTAALSAQSTSTTSPCSLNFDEVMRHPLVQQELHNQVQDLEFVETLPPHMSTQTISSIKKFAHRN